MRHHEAGSGKARGGCVEVRLIEYHRGMPGAIGFGPDLDPEGVAEAPLKQPRHRARVRLAGEQPGVPLLGSVEVRDGAVRENAADHVASWMLLICKHSGLKHECW